MDLQQIPYSHPATDDLCEQCDVEVAGDGRIGIGQRVPIALLPAADPGVYFDRYFFSAVLPAADHPFPGRGVPGGECGDRIRYHCTGAESYPSIYPWIAAGNGDRVDGFLPGTVDS